MKLSKRDQINVLQALRYAESWAFSLIDAHQGQNGEDMVSYKKLISVWRKEERTFKKLHERLLKKLKP